VNKDRFIVILVSFLVIALFFKLIILSALQEVYQKNEVKEKTNKTDLNCQILLNTHSPQVFLVIGMLVFFLKIVILSRNIKE
jgi:Na+/melibiose symporter-like transporter